jgi:YVTN family beta-propeller protein
LRTREKFFEIFFVERRKINAVDRPMWSNHLRSSPLQCPLMITFKFCTCIAALAIFGACSPAPESPPTAAARDSGVPAGRLYVTNENSGDLSVVDTATKQVVATIPLGKRPRGIKVSPDGTLLYVALSGSPMAPPGTDERTLPPPDRTADGIGVVDIAQLRLLRIIHGGTDPEQTAISGDGRRLFVANEDAGQVSVIDVGDGRVIATVPVGGEPEGVDLRPDGKVVYVTSEADNQVAVIDVDTARLITTFKAGPRPRATGFLPDSSRAYVSAENGAAVIVVDTQAHKPVATITLEGGDLVRPMGVVASGDGTRIFVSTGRGKSVVIIDTATNNVVGTVEVGERPWGIAATADGSMVFTANGPSNDVSFVDVVNRRVAAKVTVGDRPWGVIYVP